uniref:Elongator complex protein 2 n=1 Tax=Neogobius melanostomus TaxID=47308 RepID=A0A8C6T1K0_9GOBI
MAPSVFKTCHVACCANRTPNVISWNRGGTIAFGTCNSVALYNPQERIIVALLNGHTGRVNAVQWIHRADCGLERHLVSAGSDNRLIVWECHNDTVSCSVECRGHTAPVSSVDGIYMHDSQVLVASSASDSTVRLWLCSGGTTECLHTLSFGSGFMMDVSLALLPGSRVPILACGGDDSRVHLYVLNHGKDLQKALTLQGHEDWIRGLAWAPSGGELLLASCSQDCLIRVWRLCAKSGTDAHTDDDPTIIKMKEDIFEFAVSLETVLAGHENWVYGVHWQPPFTEQPLSLLSASMDKTMILWAPEDGSEVWVEQVRVGEVGGNTLGFLGCQMSPDGSMIMAHAFHGALHLWCKDQGDKWGPGVVISGHFNAVQDLSWDPEGEFVLSVGSDQTTRLFTPWRKQDSKQLTWHEISRPQIHGFDMQCLAMVGQFQFVSGADEKVLRVFQAPRNFVENFANISGISKEKLFSTGDAANLPEGASTPALGLSNKAVFQGKVFVTSVSFCLCQQYFGCTVIFCVCTCTEPPPEDHLLQNTLWPEVQKLYGHGFETFCVAADSGGTLVASACKATKAEHASILLWDTSSWRQVQALSYHTLTVTQMAFSPDSRFLLAVSRDRTWSLWKRNSQIHFSLFAHTAKESAIHTRIIWSCDWSPDGAYFVTCSRDKKVTFVSDFESIEPTGLNDELTDHCDIKPCSSILDVGDSATASRSVLYLVAVGLESGRILLYKWSPGLEPDSDWNCCGQTDSSQSHCLAVKRLRWRPRAGRAGHGHSGGVTQEEEKNGQADSESSWAQLASASTDHSVKIFSVNKQAL